MSKLNLILTNKDLSEQIYRHKKESIEKEIEDYIDNEYLEVREIRECISKVVTDEDNNEFRIYFNDEGIIEDIYEIRGDYYDYQNNEEVIVRTDEEGNQKIKIIEEWDYELEENEEFVVRDTILYDEDGDEIEEEINYYIETDHYDYRVFIYDNFIEEVYLVKTGADEELEEDKDFKFIKHKDYFYIKLVHNIFYKKLRSYEELFTDDIIQEIL